MNLPKNQPPQPIIGPTVIFDNSEDIVESINNIHSDHVYSESSSYSMLHRYFPRESACDFRIRANIDSLVHNYTVQCVLPINMYNEQLFLLLWAWLWLVCIANCYDLVIWITRLLPGSRYNYVRERIRLKYSENSVKRNLHSFVYDYLTFDGVFMMRIMSLSMSDCVTHEIIQTLWQNYTEPSRGRQAGSNGGEPNSRASMFNQRYSSRATGGARNGADNDQDSRFSANYVNVETI